jgi:hypothetical protein
MQGDVMWCGVVMMLLAGLLPETGGPKGIKPKLGMALGVGVDGISKEHHSAHYIFEP